MRYRFAVALLLSIIAALVVAPATLGQNQPFSLTIAPPSKPIKSGAKVYLLVTVTNTTDHTTGLIRSSGSLPDEGFRYHIDVRDSGGHERPQSARLRGLKGKMTMSQSSNLARWLKPGESFVDRIAVTRFYDVTLPGEYSVSVARHFDRNNIAIKGIPPEAIGSGIVKSNTVTITIIK
ncbi:MAG TPA: hypothetical protein VGR93_00370 [Candidatus Acidoferrales bacterium]|nr:hypothetical protein [Candidatus Acidoferrales bacterium]